MKRQHMKLDLLKTLTGIIFEINKLIHLKSPLDLKLFFVKCHLLYLYRGIFLDIKERTKYIYIYISKC